MPEPAVPRLLTALPVYNEVGHVRAVIEQVLRYSTHVLVVDDGSTDGTAQELARCSDVRVITHPRNLGYGAALASAFEFTLRQAFDVLVTIDCDGQHEPQRIGQFAAACTDEVDIVSGSRYLASFDGDSTPPADRRRINQEITRDLNRQLGLRLTDAFCGFKAYRAEALAKLEVREPGYAMPLEVWVQAASLGLRIVELPVPLIYLDEERSFGGSLDDSRQRLDHYRQVLDRAMATWPVGKAQPAPSGEGQR